MPAEVDAVLAMIRERQQSLQAIADQASTERNYKAAMERLKRWRDKTQQLVGELVSAKEGERFGNKRYAMWSTNRSYPHRPFNDQVDDARNGLAALYEAIKEDGLRYIRQAAGSTQAQAAEAQGDSHRVFVVHGHDHGLRAEVARFLERLGLEAIILDEQPKAGRTIIENFERYADVRYAVVLLTGDDRGGTRDQSYEDQRLRARQNVIFELGYFAAKLGRQHVCALHEAGVEIPSDYQGVLYVSLDPHGGWRLHLAKELRAAGLPVDLNLV